MLSTASYHTANFCREATPDEIGQRIDRSILKLPQKPSKHFIQRLLRLGYIRVNHQKIASSYRLQRGDWMEFPKQLLDTTLKEPADHLQKKLKHLGKALLKTMLYEDECLLICNKPSGIAVHGGSAQKEDLISALRLVIPHGSALNLVHRLDKPTSGVLMFAKNLRALRDLHQQLSENAIQKVYLAITEDFAPHNREEWTVDGDLEKTNHGRNGEASVALSKSGKSAQTTFCMINRFSENLFLVKICPKQGRMHQIRVHAASCGSPILGDYRYGARKVQRKNKKGHSELGGKFLIKLPRDAIFLHASEISFTHPFTKEKILIQAPLPSYWPEIPKN